MNAIPCAILRGGTSKGVFVLEEHLPVDPGLRDRVLLELMGSPDPRQIDGLGGADPLTSKVAIVSRSWRPGIDIDYESVEVGVADTRVTHGLMCGNLIAAAGYFAIAEGLVAARAPMTRLRIHSVSNNATVTAELPLSPGGDPLATARRGEARVRLRFDAVAGSCTGALLPLGEATSRLPVAGRTLEVSVVDAGVPYAFIQATAIGSSGHEPAESLDANAALREQVEQVRAEVARRLAQRGVAIAARGVKVALVAPPADPRADVAARIINVERVHKACAVSGAIVLAAAAVLPGSVVNAIARPQTAPLDFRIAHPGGIMPLRLHWQSADGRVTVESAEFVRGARLIMRGTSYLREAELVRFLPPLPAVRPAVTA